MVDNLTIDYVDDIKNLWKQNKDNLSIPFTKEIINPIQENRMFGIIVDGKLAGFCAYRVLKRNPAIMVDHLCVSKEFRNRGFAREILKKINSVTPKALPMVLTCRDGSENNTFYDKFAKTYKIIEKKTMKLRLYTLNREKLR